MVNESLASNFRFSFRKQLGDIDKTKLKTLDALKEPGRSLNVVGTHIETIAVAGSKEGETKMVRNGDQVEVYQVRIFAPPPAVA